MILSGAVYGLSALLLNCHVKRLTVKTVELSVVTYIMVCVFGVIDFQLLLFTPTVVWLVLYFCFSLSSIEMKVHAFRTLKNLHRIYIHSYTGLFKKH